MSRKKIARILLVLAVFASLTLTELTPLSLVQDASAVTQADIDKLKDELSGMNSEKSQLEKELKSIQNDKSAALAQKENIDKQINLLQSEITSVESLISNYESLITQTEQEIRENEEEEARQYEKFCERVRSMEERGTVSYWSVLFDSASFSDLLSAMDFISEIMDSDQKVIDDLRALREQIEQKKASLETSLAEQQSAKETLVAKKSELNTQRAEAEKVLAELKANEAQYKQVLSEKDAAMERQQAEIVRLSRELAEKNGNTTVTYGGYIWPCSSKYVTSPLGARYTGIAGASTNHAGIDIGRVGYTTQAVAAKAGTVIISAYNKYRGNYVVVSHGSGNTTTYQHLSSRSVSVGTYVAQGQVVGITGTTGVSSGRTCTLRSPRTDGSSTRSSISRTISRVGKPHNAQAPRHILAGSFFAGRGHFAGIGLLSGHGGEKRRAHALRRALWRGLRIARRGNACCTFGQARSKIPAKAQCELCRVSQGLSICGGICALWCPAAARAAAAHGKGGRDHPPRDGAARPCAGAGTYRAVRTLAECCARSGGARAL